MAARIMKSVDERVALLDQKIAKKQAEINALEALYLIHI